MTGRLPLAVGAALAVGLLLTACTGETRPGPAPSFGDPVVPAGELRLVAFDSCAEALDRLKQAARQYVGPYGFAGSRPEMAVDGGMAPEAARAAAPAAPLPDAQPGAAAGAGHSGTTTHEAGVDEPDLVKTDGRRIVTVSRGVLRVVDPAARRVTSRLDLAGTDDDPVRWSAANLLLHGDRALVLIPEAAVQYAPSGVAGPDTVPGRVPPVDEGRIAGARLVLVDLSGDPRILGSYTMDGSLVDARQVDGTVRVVVRSAPRLAFRDDGQGTDAQRLAASQAVIDAARLTDWLPRYEVTTGGRTTTGQVDCASMHRPASYTGTSMVTVLTFDLAAASATTGLGDGAPVTVVADGDTVYSNGPSLYVANDQRWRAMPADSRAGATIRQPEARTEIYKFDTSGAGRPAFVAAGSVDGWLLNQYALSEWDGHLRVATTTGLPWDRAGRRTESAVHVLRQDGRSLVRTGRVGGLGRGEQIYAVRFVGAAGYVVTFRRTDPLYTVDLRNPSAPAVTGELKIPGYSAYLHPAGDGRLIGVGQEATDQGRVQGTQVSLFDVADPARPARLAQHHIRDSYSEAESDPHAFLYWPADRLLVIPLSARTASGSTAMLLRVGEGAITERAAVRHPTSASAPGGEYIRRSLVIDGTLWTVSDAGLRATSLSTLDMLGWVPLT